MGSFRGRLRRAFWPHLKDSDIIVESPSGDMMKDMATLPASAARRTTPLADGIRNLEWIVRVFEDKDTTPIRRVRLQDDTSSLRESGLVPSLNVSELVLRDRRGSKLTWDSEWSRVGNLCRPLCRGLDGVTLDGVYVKKHLSVLFVVFILQMEFRVRHVSCFKMTIITHTRIFIIGTCTEIPDVDLLIANHAVMPPTSLSANIKYSSICSEKNEDFVLAIKMGLGLSWKFNSLKNDRSSHVTRYVVFGAKREGIFNHILKDNEYHCITL